MSPASTPIASKTAIGKLIVTGVTTSTTAIAVSSPGDAVDDVGEDEPQVEPLAERDRLRDCIVVLGAVADGANQSPVHHLPPFVDPQFQSHAAHSLRPSGREPMFLA